MSSDLKICPVCGVSISETGQVNFSSGAPGTRSRLYARVCQYTDNKACINQDAALVGEVSPSDRFEEGRNLLPTLEKPDS